MQIRRPNPHPPEHTDPTSPISGQSLQEPSTDSELISEPATCPFCKQPELGITYERPAFQRGLAYVNQQVPPSDTSGIPSIASSASSQSNSLRRRAMSLPASAASVITVDHLRPDWDQKLMNARTHQARRSAAATALHTAAYMMGSRGYDEGRFHFGRRSLLRRMSAADGPTSSSNPHFNIVSMLSENQRSSSDARANGERESSLIHRGAVSRTRIDDMEEMMMMEAIRLSLASEEERRKKEEKEARKDAKKKDKETKKAEKAARKAGYPHDSAAPTEALAGKGKNPQQDDDVEAVEAADVENVSDSFRGRMLESTSNAQDYLEKARHQIQPMGFPTERPGSKSHLQESSYTSSLDNDSNPGSLGFQESSSSLELSANASFDDLASVGVPQANSSSPTPAGSSSKTEPTANFSSLTAMIDRSGEVKQMKQAVDAGTESSSPTIERGRDADVDSNDERFYDSHTDSDVKIPETSQETDQVIHQTPQTS